MNDLTNPYAGWEVFNLIVGATSGALIGFQGLASALAADTDDADEPPTNAATVAHFSASLALCSLCGVPWTDTVTPTPIWTAAGLAGMVYVLQVTTRMFQAGEVAPQVEDIAFHSVLPFTAYMALAVACLFCLPSALFLVGYACLTLLLIGIHNAYDSVMFQVFLRKMRR